MSIKTIGDGRWGVFADWLGETRCVYSGTLFECIAWSVNCG